jgi:tetratricopeptide (TPR) repeat protein
MYPDDQTMSIVFGVIGLLVVIAAWRFLAFMVDAVGSLFREETEEEKAQKQLRGQIRDLKKISKAAPEDFESRLKLGQAYLMSGTPEHRVKAIECFQNVISQSPLNGYAHFSLGKAYAGQGQTGDAYMCYERTIDSEADSAILAQAHIGLAFRYKDRDELEECDEELSRALALDPSSHDSGDVRLLLCQVPKLNEKYGGKS